MAYQEDSSVANDEYLASPVVSKTRLTTENCTEKKALHVHEKKKSKHTVIENEKGGKDTRTLKAKDRDDFHASVPLLSACEFFNCVPSENPKNEQEASALSSHSSAPTTHANLNGSSVQLQDDRKAFQDIEKNARIALEIIATQDPRDSTLQMENINNYIQTLKVYRNACQDRAMYKEAYLIQQVLRNLRLDEESRHVRGLTELQIQERRDLEESHRKQFREFHHIWNERIDAFEEAQMESEIQLLERQNNELLAFHEEMRSFSPRLLRYSRGLIESRTRQHTLAQQRDYISAYNEKAKADAIDSCDLERFEEAKLTMYERRERLLRQQHQQEFQLLQTKADSRRWFLERHRKRELDEQLQHYINARRDLENQQNVVRSKTGTLLLKHACNTKTDFSGSAALLKSASSGAFGSVVRQRHAEEPHSSANSYKPKLSVNSSLRVRGNRDGVSLPKGA